MELVYKNTVYILFDENNRGNRMGKRRWETEIIHVGHQASLSSRPNFREEKVSDQIQA